MTIIGAGIGGLVCGCYLVKSGYKVLIVEQHDKPGGYCTSFQRRGYRFDSAIHYLGGINNGILGKIIDELNIRNKLKFYQPDPTDKIIMPDEITYIRKDHRDTLKEWQKSFPKEKTELSNFFKFISQKDVLNIYGATKNKSFRKILNSFFSDEHLKSALGVPLFGNMGLPPGRISAFTAIILFREFILDPGYYPEGGMQNFSDVLAQEFKSNNGDLLLSEKVINIGTANNEVTGVKLNSGEKINSRFVVSNCDAFQTFNTLLKQNTKEAAVTKKLKPSNSIFCIYTGVLNFLKKEQIDPCNIWYFKTYDLERSYTLLGEKVRDINIPGVMLSFPSLHDKTAIKDTVQIFTMATFETKKFWDRQREAFAKKMFFMAKNILPSLANNLDVVITATPHTFYRYTYNYKGAAFGWESTLNQIDSSLLPQKTSIKGLFLVGHWCTMGSGQGGVSTVALSGMKAAKSIMTRSL